ncbi:MAG: SpaA isopeptide-forming pilin-related protein, partial [Eubacteriales bacterium]|nr:SpaA isopeptide-forming pilin-related protein [Eubacteriales bacterium]
VYLEYSNNPNQTGTGTTETGKTPEDEVLVFTYELDVTKVDGQNADTKLSGAEFVLLNSDKRKAAVVADGKITGWADVTTADGKTTYPAGSTLTSGVDGKFVIAGLDAGSYYLVETKAPAGYNLLKNPIKVTIAATLDKTENNPALTALTISVDGGAAKDGNLTSGAVETNVENNQGATLPETGGAGTTAFYIIGGCLVLAAAVLLVTKKRMSSKG